MKCPCDIRLDMGIYRGISLPDDSSRTAILDQALDVPRWNKFFILGSGSLAQIPGHLCTGFCASLVYPGKYLRSAAAGSPYVLITI